jgi:hypothetical protein
MPVQSSPDGLPPEGRDYAALKALRTGYVEQQARLVAYVGGGW